MKWIVLAALILITATFICAVPYAFITGWVLMQLPGSILLPGALITAYFGFFGKLWRKAWRLFADTSTQA